jgi:predicted ester cyclase
MTIAASLETAREATVREHMASEERRDFAATLGSFARPRYEVIATGDVYDGGVAVTGMLEETLAAFPDFHFVETRLHHAADVVFVETEFRGTHEGPWRGLPATGRRVAYRMGNVFVFEGEGLVCERLFFDLLTVLRQLGIARDPTTLAGRLTTFANHPVVVGKAFLAQLAASRRGGTP